MKSLPHLFPGCLETRRPLRAAAQLVPLPGRGRPGSIPARRIFHGMENFSAIFPRYGKLFRKFSTLWKIFFHTVENSARRLRCAALNGPSTPGDVHRLRATSIQVSSFKFPVSCIIPTFHHSTPLTP